MLPDVGLPELLLIAVVALVLGKPEDLPEIMRKMGVMAASLRSWASGLWAGLEESAAEPVKGVKKRPTRRKKVGK